MIQIIGADVMNCKKAEAGKKFDFLMKLKAGVDIPNEENITVQVNQQNLFMSELSCGVVTQEVVFFEI